jgi:hypothetical protein
MPARYQCFTHGQGWSWRLLGANNRVLARSPEPLPDPVSAVVDARAVSLLAAEATVELVSHAGKSWRWVLIDGGTVRATSAVPYARRMECVRAVSRFRACAAEAEMTQEHLVFPGGGRQPPRPHRVPHLDVDLRPDPDPPATARGGPAQSPG